MVNFARQGKLWWRLVAILTRKFFCYIRFLEAKDKSNHLVEGN